MSNSANSQSFSTIKFFKLFQRALTKVNSVPLSMRNLTIQQDAYARLAHLEESDSYLDSPDVFATIENSKKEKDTDLRFIVQLASGCFMMEIEGLYSAVYDLRDRAVFDDEADAMRQLIHVLTMLANGQISAGLTLYGDEVCASEMILADRSAQRYVIATVPAFKRASKRASIEDLDHMVLKNHYPLDALALSERSFLYDVDAQNKVVEYGRSGQDAMSQPLVYEELEENIQDRVKTNIGQKFGESNLVYLFRSWEFWLIGLILGVIPVSLRLLGYLPQFLIDNPTLCAVPFTILAAFLTPYVKEKRLAHKHKTASRS